jgi:hypothetical protein
MACIRISTSSCDSSLRTMRSKVSIELREEPEPRSEHEATHKRATAASTSSSNLAGSPFFELSLFLIAESIVNLLESNFFRRAW